jgi:hypothetical protein
MDAFPKMLVLLSVAATLAAGCGGREEDAAASQAPAARTEAAGPLAHLSPKELEALKNYRKAYVANSGGDRKAADSTSAANARPPAANARPPKVSNTTTIESADGSAIELPDTFASDLPIFPGSTPTRHVTSPTAGTLTEFDTDQTVDEARRFYSDELGQSGWMLMSDLAEEGMALIIAEKDGRDFSVAITNEAGGTKITTMEMQIP